LKHAHAQISASKRALTQYRTALQEFMDFTTNGKMPLRPHEE